MGVFKTKWTRPHGRFPSSKIFVGSTKSVRRSHVLVLGSTVRRIMITIETSGWVRSWTGQSKGKRLWHRSRRSATRSVSVWDIDDDATTSVPPVFSNYDIKNTLPYKNLVIVRRNETPACRPRRLTPRSRPGRTFWTRDKGRSHNPYVPCAARPEGDCRVKRIVKNKSNTDLNRTGLSH